MQNTDASTVRIQKGQKKVYRNVIKSIDKVFVLWYNVYRK